MLGLDGSFPWFIITTASSANSHLVCCDLAAFRTQKCVNQLKSAEPGGPKNFTLNLSDSLLSCLCSANWLLLHLCFVAGLLSLRSYHWNDTNIVSEYSWLLNKVRHSEGFTGWISGSRIIFIRFEYKLFHHGNGDVGCWIGQGFALFFSFCNGALINADVY